MSDWAPETSTLSPGAQLVFANDLDVKQQQRVLNLQCDVPELREQIKAERKHVAQRTGDAKKAATRKLASARAQLHRTGESLRAMSCGVASHSYHADNAWWQSAEDLHRDTGVKFEGGALRFGGVYT